MDQQETKALETQKLIHRITRLAGVGFLGGGILILVMGGDMILGSALTIVGLTDIVLIPRIIEKMMIAKLKQRNDKGQ
jgi:hypothetical protein